MVAPWTPSRPVLEPTYITGLPLPWALPVKIRSRSTSPSVKAFTRILAS